MAFVYLSAQMAEVSTPGNEVWGVYDSVNKPVQTASKGKIPPSSTISASGSARRNPKIPVVERATFVIKSSLVDQLRQNSIPTLSIMRQNKASVKALTGPNLDSLGTELAILRKKLASINQQRQARLLWPLSGTPASECEYPSLATLENEISSLGNLVIALDSQLQRRRELLDLTSSLLAPIRRMPAELLARIFDFACECNHFGLNQRCFHLPAFVVSQVCFCWRSVALGISRTIWSRIHISFDRHATRFNADAALNTLQECIIRSGASPLSLGFSYTASAGLESCRFICSPSFDPQRRLVQATLRQAFRWAELKVNPILAPAFDYEYESPTMLHKLSIEDRSSNSYTHRETLMTFLCRSLFTEEPQKLRIYNSPVWAFKCATFQRHLLDIIDLHSFPCNEVSALHQFSPSVVNLSLSLLRPSESDSDALDNLIAYNFDCMKNLSLTFSGEILHSASNTVIARTLSQITARVLQMLTLKAFFSVMLTDGCLSSFLSKSSHITVLKLVAIQIGDDEFKRCLHSLPQLKMLELEDSEYFLGEEHSSLLLIPTKLQMLEADPGSQLEGILLPRLTELKLTWWTKKKFYKVLPRAIESRSLHPNCEALRDLTMKCGAALPRGFAEEMIQLGGRCGLRVNGLTY